MWEGAIYARDMRLSVVIYSNILLRCFCGLYGGIFSTEKIKIASSGKGACASLPKSAPEVAS
jgi:hypothetical protein